MNSLTKRICGGTLAAVLLLSLPPAGALTIRLPGAAPYAVAGVAEREPVTVSSAQQLLDAVRDAQPGDTIALLADITLDSSVEIDKNLVLDGRGRTVTANQCAAFSIKADLDSLEIRDLTIKGAKADAPVRETVSGEPYMGIGTYNAAWGVAQLKLTDVTVDGFTYGLYFGKNPTGQTQDPKEAPLQIEALRLTIQNCYIKGAYFETLTRSSFTDCRILNNGSDPSLVSDTDGGRLRTWMSGVDLNLKNGTYEEIAFQNCTFQGNGTNRGTALHIKARSDGNYGEDTRLTGVTISGCTFEDNNGTDSGLEGTALGPVVFGEPGKQNPSPTQIAIQPDVSYTNNLEGVVTVAFDGSGGSDGATAIVASGSPVLHLPASVREGYTFQGWYTQPDGGQEVTDGYLFQEDATVYAQWAEADDENGEDNESGEAGDGEGTGGDGGSGENGGAGGETEDGESQPAPSLPETSGDTTTVTTEVKPTVSDGTAKAEVPASTMDKTVESVLSAAADSNTSPVVEIVVGGSEADAVEVTLPVSSLDTLGRHESASLVVTSQVAVVTLDSAAITSAAGQAQGQQLTLSVSPVDAGSLSQEQQAAVGEDPVFELQLKSGAAHISHFEGGTATVSVPHTLSDGQEAGGVVVYHLDDMGNVTPRETTHHAQTGRTTFTTPHFSKYVMGYDETRLWSNPFSDVTEGDYFYRSVLWAVNAGITSGISDTAFGPNGLCTRAQTVTFLWRAAGSPEPQSTVNPFADVQESDFYYSAVLWAVEQGITAGISEDAFGPNLVCSRAQAVTFLWRVWGGGAAARAADFADVAQDAYYREAVQWAVSEGITSGTSDTTFGPEDSCTRSQMVTFLYRAVGEGT